MLDGSRLHSDNLGFTVCIRNLKFSNRVISRRWEWRRGTFQDHGDDGFRQRKQRMRTSDQPQPASARPAQPVAAGGRPLSLSLSPSQAEQTGRRRPKRRPAPTYAGRRVTAPRLNSRAPVARSGERVPEPIVPGRDDGHGAAAAGLHAAAPSRARGARAHREAPIQASPSGEAGAATARSRRQPFQPFRSTTPSVPEVPR